MVYVISQSNKPLMPCSNVIARLLLKQCKAYMKNTFTFDAEYKKWWRNKIKGPIAMHRANKIFIETCLVMLLDAKSDKMMKTLDFESIYNRIVEEVNQ